MSPKKIIRAIKNKKVKITDNLSFIVEGAVQSDRDRVYANVDSRLALPLLPDSCVDTVITSPPYGDVKNYGTEGEIGYGQSIDDEYLDDLEKILAELHRVSASGAALWLVLDMFRYRGRTIALPFELMEKARKVGWHLQDMIVWDKGRSLPWSHRGRFRRVSEHILLFSKGDRLKHFNLDGLRSTFGLSSYWVKYPERFHPDGKAPTDIWHIPIPTQGSWSAGSKAKHFCPFPIELVRRMVALTTKKDGVVLDPFCGTGSVLVAANSLGRLAVGFDINRKFFEDYKSHGAKALEQEANALTLQDSGQSDMRRTIIALRANKYAASLYRSLLKRQSLDQSLKPEIYGIIVSSLKIFRTRNDNHIASIKVAIVAANSRDAKLKNAVKASISNPPLSKFGLDVDCTVVNPSKAVDLLKQISTGKNEPNSMYKYKNLNFNIYSERVKVSTLIENPDLLIKKGKSPTIFSTLKVNVSPGR